jgi:hypothetical protein
LIQNKRLKFNGGGGGEGRDCLYAGYRFVVGRVLWRCFCGFAGFAVCLGSQLEAFRAFGVLKLLKLPNLILVKLPAISF